MRSAEAIGSNSPVTEDVIVLNTAIPQQEIPVPDACIDGFCKLILYKNATIGAYGPGYVWEVYYIQSGEYHNWIGGPNTDLGGFNYSDGSGVNGNGQMEGVILGGETSDGGYIRIFDDGDIENDPNLWTVVYQSSPSLNQVFLQACPIEGCSWETVTEDTVIPIPEPCQSDFCMITRYTDATFGAFGPGFSMPVYIDSNAGDSANDWIGGPLVSLGGMNFSNGHGNNGDGDSDAIFTGGLTAGGGYAMLRDDGLENADDEWSIFFKGDGELTEAIFEFCPMHWGDLQGFVDRSEEDLISSTPPYCRHEQYIVYNDGFIPYEESDNQFSFDINAELVDVDAIDGEGTGLLCDTVGVGDLTGKVALVTRGSCFFDTKINNAESLGAVAVIVYNNEPGTLTMETPVSSLPAGSISQENGLALKTMAPIEVLISPTYSLCTILRWTDARMGAFGPGLSWPVYYEQNSLDNTWLGGPNLCIGGMCFSDGGGTNGDTNTEFVFEGGTTSPNYGYTAIYDDADWVGETSPLFWDYRLNPQDDLTSALYYIFPNICSKTTFDKTEQIFDDVLTTNWAFAWISRLYRAGITTGCSTVPMNYCPGDNVNRAQMAVFLERGMRGSDYEPPTASGNLFADVKTSTWGAGWIEKLYEDGITSGCKQNPLSYCPQGPVTREQMALFLLRAKYGSEYTPPDVGDSTGFDDVPTTHWAAAWIKELAATGITTGCGYKTFCPGDPVTRDQMATFLVRTFGLP